MCVCSEECVVNWEKVLFCSEYVRFLKEDVRVGEQEDRLAAQVQKTRGI